MEAAKRRRKTDRFVPLGKPPESVRQHPAYQMGERVAAGREDFPLHYYEQIRRTAELARGWVRDHPKAALRWIEQDEKGYVAMAPLEWAPYFCDSEDAFRLVEWLVDQMGRQLSFNQVHAALQLAAIVPAGEDSLSRRSTRVGDIVCAVCGSGMDLATSYRGAKPKPGDLMICVECGSAHAWDGKGVRLCDEAELAALPEDTRRMLRLMREGLGKVKEQQ